MANATFSNVSPWGLRPLDPIVSGELQRRSQNYGMSPNLGSYKPSYSGPRTAWVRVCSNASIMNQSNQVMDGFVLGQVHGFNDTYGFGTNSSGQKNSTILGYTVGGTPHSLMNSNSSTFSFRPAPGIIGIDTEFFGASTSFPALCRKVIIKWRCNSVDQLNYMFPYFLSPGISVIIEWGWNNFNPASLIDLTDIGSEMTDTSPGTGIKGLFTNSNLIYNRIGISNGNYDCHVGRTCNYSYKMNSDGGFECTTEVWNSSILLEGQNLRLSSVTNDGLNTPIKDFKTTVDNNIDNFAKKGAHCKLPGYDELLWIPMSRFAEFINRNLNLNIPASGTGTPTHKILKFDISNVVISGHPLLKSTDKDVLIPNQYSPTLITDTGATIDNTTSEQTYANSQFSVWKNDFSNLGLAFQFYDLTKFIPTPDSTSSLAASFPQYSNLADADGRANVSGYWGYLNDIYISTKLIRNAVENNDTTLVLIESILNTISQAGSKIWNFSVITDPVGNTSYSVIDHNYNTWSSTATNNNIPIFNIGSSGPSGSGAFTEMSMDVKMSQEMMSQAMLGQNKYTYQSQNPADTSTLPNKNPVISNNDAKVNLYTSVDRLYGTSYAGNTTKVTPEEKKKMSLGRDKRNTDDVKFHDKKNNQHTATEWDTNLMETLVKLGNQASYLSSPTMPATEVTLECLGIAGIRYLDMISLDGVPLPYSYKRAVCQIIGVKSTVENNFWKTSVTTQVRPITITEATMTTPSPQAP